MRENVVSYKYNYNTRKASGFYLNKAKIRYLLIAFVLFIGLSYKFMTDGAWIFFIILCVIWVALSYGIVDYAGEKRLYITPRYLLCGDKIIYYHNVTAINMQELAGKITIETPTITLTLDRENFPTNARKEHKIAKNKDEKFRKVSNKIFKRVNALNPRFMNNISANHPNSAHINQPKPFSSQPASNPQANSQPANSSDSFSNNAHPSPFAPPSTQSMPAQTMSKTTPPVQPERHRQNSAVEQKDHVSDFEKELLDFDFKLDDD